MSTAAPTAPRRTDDAVLDAARAEIVDHGVRRATVTAIAARAGVARVTVYRRGGGIDQLVLDCLSREFDTITAAAQAAVHADATAREALIHGLQLIQRALRDSELVQAMLRHDPELLVPYLVERLGHSQRTVRDVLRLAIAAGVADGSMRADLDPDRASLTLLLALQSFLLSSDIIRAESSLAAMDAEATRLVDSYVRPGPA